MRFEAQRLSDYSDDALLAEIRRVAASLGTSCLSKAHFTKVSRISASTVQRRFGSWHEALAKAGVGHLSAGQTVSAKMREQRARRMSDEDVLAELRAIAQRLGVESLKVQDVAEHSEVSAAVVRSRFGSWKEGLRRAGLAVTRTGMRYTEMECFENLLRVWTHYGRQPKYLEMKDPPSIVGPKAYVSKRGSWMRAIDAFLAHVESNEQSDVGEQPLVGDSGSRSSTGRSTSDACLSIGEQRRVPLRYRYQVLLRDRFRCVLCGGSPATTPACELHVDHMIPFSKGGRTILENLRTLCAPCNLGKGDLVEPEVPGHHDLSPLPNRALQPTRAAQPFGQRDPSRGGPRG